MTHGYDSHDGHAWAMAPLTIFIEHVPAGARRPLIEHAGADWAVGNGDAAAEGGETKQGREARQHGDLRGGADMRDGHRARDGSHARDGGESAGGLETVILSFERRQRRRQLAVLASGREIGIELPRGSVLRGGDLLLAADGETVLVVAAPEDVSTARAEDPQRLARAAYHLGNRHAALQVGRGWVRYPIDPALDHMVQQLGLEIVHERRPFEPEAGAYSHAHGEHEA